MATPTDVNARRFYRVAQQRLSDGEALLADGRPGAAVYLSGYAVECILKALLLAYTPAGERPEVLETFRGAIAHNLGWLRQRVVARMGHLPTAVSGELLLVRSWSTDLRYQPGLGDRDDAEAFLNATRAILKWADGRM